MLVLLSITNSSVQKDAKEAVRLTCEGKWKEENMQKTIKHVERHKDGTVLAKGNKVNGVLDGYWDWFRKDGSKMRSGYFKKGQQVGEWMIYDKKGKAYRTTMKK